MDFLDHSAFILGGDNFKDNKIKILKELIEKVSKVKELGALKKGLETELSESESYTFDKSILEVKFRDSYTSNKSNLKSLIEVQNEKEFD